MLILEYNHMITKKEYERWLVLDEKFKSCLRQYAKELSILTKNCEVGDFIMDDFELNDNNDGYIVWFKPAYYQDIDVIEIPLKYIYDKKYRRTFEKHNLDSKC